jgi:hypothetical protein
MNEKVASIITITNVLAEMTGAKTIEEYIQDVVDGKSEEQIQAEQMDNMLEKFKKDYNIKTPPKPQGSK